MSEPQRDAVVVFARLPVPGRVKTRLAASVGNEAAALFYQRCAERVVAALGRLVNAAIYLFYSQAEEKAAVAAWLEPLQLPSLTLVPQLQHPNLGARLDHAMRHAFQQGHQRVAVVGTDVPDLDAEVVRRALQALDTYQALFGPADDGGYYLLALAALPAGLFEGIEWSTPGVLAASIANAERLGLHVAPLNTLSCLLDIDTVEDLRSWCQSQQQAAEAAAVGQDGAQQQPQQQGRQQQRLGSVGPLLEVALQVIGEQTDGDRQLTHSTVNGIFPTGMNALT